MTAPSGTGLSAKTIREALARHYRKPGAARDGEILIPEVEAPGSLRRADLVRVGMWKSRGTGIDVHEIKVSRGDWLRELDDPAKAESWWPYCNRFWIVAVPGVVRDGELPEGWGLLELPKSGRRFKNRVPAATRTDIQLTTSLLVQLLRRADNMRLSEIEEIRNQHRQDLNRVDSQWRDRRAGDELPYDVQRKLEMLGQIEAAIGMPVTKWTGWPLDTPEVTPGELGVYMKDLRDHVTVQRRRAQLERERQRLCRTAESVLDHAGTEEGGDLDG